jgi:hypothetical protein
VLRQLQQARKDYEDSDSFAGFYDGFTDELAGLAVHNKRSTGEAWPRQQRYF